MRRLEWVFAVTALVAICVPALAVADDEPAPAKPATEEGAKKETVKPKGPEMDAVAKEVYEGYYGKLYSMGAEVKRASCVIKASMTTGTGEMAQTFESQADYTWNGKEGTLTWSEEMLGNMLAQQGWSRENLDRWFTPEKWRKDFDGCKLGGKKLEDGTTLVSVEGKQKDGIKSSVFDKDGLMTSTIMAIEIAPGMPPQDFTFELTHKKLGEKYLMTSWSFEAQIEGMGKLEETTEIAYAEVDGILVLAKVVSKGSMAGTPTAKVLEFCDWKLNDELK